jgi:hypothetical protein
MSLPIHTDIMDKLTYFHSIRKIPNIIFHGTSGCGKRTIVHKFIRLIYNGDRNMIKSYVMHVNCAHGKGIKFVREDIKFFAKTHIHSNGGDTFKSIVLLNADKLTIDAQSALRRCIELFSHNTRFFIVVEDKYKLLKPILSRFCEIYIPEPIIHGKTVNLYQHNLNETFPMKDVKSKRADWLQRMLKKSFPSPQTPDTPEKLIQLSEKLYEKAYSGSDLIHFLEAHQDGMFAHIAEEKRYELLFAFNKVKKEFRNEKLLILFILNFLFVSLDFSLENITFM